MRRAYAVLPWFVAALGALHMGATWRFYTAMTPAALWFFNGGAVLVIGAVLNLVNGRYGADAPGLRWLCRGVNVFLLAFAAVSGVVDHANVADMVIVLGLLGAITALSFTPMAPRNPGA